MRRLLLPLLLLSAGCHACPTSMPVAIEEQVAAVAGVKTPADNAPCAAAEPALPGPLSLEALWQLALHNNPTLREAAAEVEMAQGQLIQAGKYPNPKFMYSQEELGTRVAPAGAVVLQVQQELLTAGKRQLDMAIAGRGTDVAAVALLTRKFEVLTRVRRGYYEYLGWWSTYHAHQQVVATLEQSVAITRKRLEQLKDRPRTDLLRLEATLQEARLNQARVRVSLEAAWQQLAAEIGLPRLPMPEVPMEHPELPQWDGPAIEQRVLAANTELKQAAVEVQRAQLEVDRARTEAVPNVTVGGGYTWNYVENTMGAVINLETPLPIWDRKQGRVHEAQARWARAQAAERSAATRLTRETAEAFGRYLAARQQVQGLTREVLPKLEETLELIRKGYQTGAAQISFADVLLAQEALNDARVRLEEVRREVWRAVADLQGLMQLDLGEELCLPSETTAP